MLDHFTLMVLHALLIAVFFAFLWKREKQERWRYFWKVLRGAGAGGGGARVADVPLPARP